MRRPSERALAALDKLARGLFVPPNLYRSLYAVGLVARGSAHKPRPVITREGRAMLAALPRCPRIVRH